MRVVSIGVQSEEYLIMRANKSTKWKIISSLSDCPGLTSIQVHNIVQKMMGAQISVQAVHKVLQEMVLQNLLLKESKRYYVDVEWIRKIRLELEQMEEQIRSVEIGDGQILVC